jgi:hypothetical protein
LNDIASLWAYVSIWLFPAAWLALGLVGLFRGHRGAGVCLVLAGVAALLFRVLFAPGSWFTRDWGTDSPMHVTFSYQPLGFLLANFLPTLSNLCLVLACALLLRRRDRVDEPDFVVTNIDARRFKIR